MAKNEDRVLKYVQDKTKIITIPKEDFLQTFCFKSHLS